MHISKLVQNYTQAILAQITQEVEQVCEQLKTATDVFDALDKQYNKRLFQEQEGQNLLIKALANLKFSQTVIKLLTKLIKKKRLALLRDITQYLPVLYLKSQGIFEAKVYSLKVLNKTETKDIVAYVKKQFNYNIKIINIVDPSILGGIKLCFDSFMLDSSLAAKLNKAKGYLFKNTKY